ncbi:hypothetical protein [Synoicihabitans lomoniglobus]|uniref:Uncharacterized protein n=1 Tax=Synoicihabitans lomoniglobus TaxID=2909285 RepID=A0AAE9ZYV5_9BACT|nr:hypothetical protein [Opitutaceae bacterium LMO-M01]WED63793.1 hypothetical protein PXH66_15760 [Opitutaceae bacterium LMO-M01]
MKLSRLVVAATITLSAVTGTVSVSYAADSTAAAKAPVTPARIDVLTAELGLSAEQSTAIKPLLKARSDELKSIRTNMALDEAGKKSATSAVMASYGERIRAELTYVQAAKYSMFIRAENGLSPKRINVLIVALSLTPEQGAQIGPLLTARKAERQAVRADMNLDADAKKASDAAIMKKYGALIRPLLTPAQDVKYTALIRSEVGLKPARIDVLAEALGLSENQIVEIAPLLKARGAALLAVTRDASMDDVAKKAAKSTIMKDYGAKIRAQMTADQRAGYRALIKAEALARA